MKDPEVIYVLMERLHATNDHARDQRAAFKPNGAAIRGYEEARDWVTRDPDHRSFRCVVLRDHYMGSVELNTHYDPHHAVMADGITVAVVPCTPECDHFVDGKRYVGLGWERTTKGEFILK